MKNHFDSGSWNVTCDRCGAKVKASEVNQEWTGFIVCKPCYEVRHPQDFVRAKQDKISVPFQRPIPTFIFQYCTSYTVQGIANVGTADCAQADRTTPAFNELLG
jgi:hypothetical protein